MKEILRHMVNIKRDLLLVLKGGMIGIANIIPGVSGGTIAVVLGIYENLIEAISNFLTNREKRCAYILFLAKVAIGAIVVLFLSAQLMKYLLENYYIYTNLAFVGLIAGSIPSIYKSNQDMKLNAASLFAFIAGAAIIFIFEFAFPHVEKQEGYRVTFELTTHSALMLCVAGFFSGGSMIVPGISGSFVMLLMGQYYIVTSALADRHLMTLVVTGIGVVLGIIVFAKLINYCLKHHSKETFYFILGLVIASLFSIYPGLPESTIGLLIAVSITILFFGISYIIGEHSSSRHL
ncbi:DUF368 domain-containing protein [candidate division KSB1 bacterium]|nr:DUF368 domain-containing protein [candidate division KSB1 bacterium]